MSDPKNTTAQTTASVDEDYEPVFPPAPSGYRYRIFVTAPETGERLHVGYGIIHEQTGELLALEPVEDDTDWTLFRILISNMSIMEIEFPEPDPESDPENSAGGDSAQNSVSAV